MWKFVYILSFVLSGILSFFLTPLSGKIAKKTGIMDIPSPRKIHKKPTPLLGGLAIFFSLLITVLLGILSVKLNFLPEGLRHYIPGIMKTLPKLSAIIGGGIVVVFFGLIDDIIGVKPFQKLFLQIFAATIIFFSGMRVSFFLTSKILSYIITTAWLVLMMNSFNLMDNMDGLSAGVSFITGGILFIFAFQMKQLFVATILSVFLGSVLGFLIHNFPPAKIFMGECGSSFLGYFLGVMAVVLTFYKYEESKTFLPIFTPLIVFSVPFFDTISVIWIRWKRKLPIFKADKNHLSHRLVKLGMSQKQAVGFIYLLTLCTGMGALLLKNLNIYGGFVVFTEIIIILGIVGILESTARSKNEQSNSILRP
ncbi:undecaprenyl/decaprenyl-phosphate alpha-N-acetylglucosaminyl 1-phosphate transferase [bacterium]|nr:undecaprenyl/decaprenyl-phosphate alpha-N-acetylglucosaminyl 1-phosphate transferase [bacterium]